MDYMDTEQIHALPDLAQYCLKKEEVQSMLVDAVPQTRGMNRYRVPLGKMWDLAQTSADLAAKRQVEGVTDAAMETPMLQEEVDALNRRFKRDYGYELDAFELLWPHLLGRLKKEIEQKSFSVIALTRCGSEAEGGRNPTTKQWSTAPGVTTVVGGMAGKQRAIENNHLMLDLLGMLLDAYTLLGNFQTPAGHKWCTRAATHEYFQFVRVRVCPPHGNWPPLDKCLHSEIQSRTCWIKHLRAGKTLTQAIELSSSERHGCWVWSTVSVNSQYMDIGAHAAGSDDPPPPVPEGGVGKSASKRQRSKGAGKGEGKPAKSKPRGGAHADGAVKSSAGNFFCEKWNTGGCTKGTTCPDGKLHSCNFLDSFGKVCGHTGKRRCNHPHT